MTSGTGSAATGGFGRWIIQSSIVSNKPNGKLALSNDGHTMRFYWQYGERNGLYKPTIPVVVSSSEMNREHVHRIDFWYHQYPGQRGLAGFIGNGNPLGRKEPLSYGGRIAILPVVEFLLVSYPIIAQLI